jgi:hypothetical protein
VTVNPARMRNHMQRRTSLLRGFAVVDAGSNEGWTPLVSDGGPDGVYPDPTISLPESCPVCGEPVEGAGRQANVPARGVRGILPTASLRQALANFENLGMRPVWFPCRCPREA